jgi:hypothetical protein
MLNLPYLNAKIAFVIAFALVLTVFGACQLQTPYQKMEARELASGIRHDSLFLGFYLSMPRKDFYKYCWDMNKQGILTGSAGASIFYMLDSTKMRGTTKMDFYPRFELDSVTVMPIKFSYEAWAPWAKKYSVDSLMPDVINLLERWHGKGFIKIEVPKKPTIYAKVDGNRRITVAPMDLHFVLVTYTDLRRHQDGRDDEFAPTAKK